ncbi:MAG: chromosome segregation protein [Solirubrobacteraceae bacterium]|nr:chromosome segregation protein [Solirubrobacteraceae bacterium]
MYLKSITLKGFKSFPDRTRLEFGPGVSVIVGPNGSGKSNVTDAVLWALGEQSPMAVRGQSMQDVIFGGAPGRQAGRSAEVELVLDDSEGTLALGTPEVSIFRRLDRNGDGEYRLAGARCRLVDVIEVLSDTGLGKEMHSVISQGRVEAIVTSKPRDRRLLIEEAAGLGKHRKRRRRAQLKLARTQDNLDRALDVEREARSRLRPLKRQAEAAELHARLERQTLEVRWELARDELRAQLAALEQAQAEVTRTRERRANVERQLQAVARRREQAEEALAERSAQREELSRRCFVAQSAGERLAYRAEAVRNATTGLEGRLEGRRASLSQLQDQHAGDAPDPQAAERIAALQTEIAALDQDRQAELARQLAELEQQLTAAGTRRAELAAATDQTRRAREESEGRLEQARQSVREAERAVEVARREAARVGGELAAVNQFLRAQSIAPGGVSTLSEELEVDPGYELALAAALDGRLSAAVVADRAAAAKLLDRVGADGGRALVDAEGFDPEREAVAPLAGAERLLDHVRGRGGSLQLARLLLADAWVVETIESISSSFRGTAVTASGRVWAAASRELRQAAAVGEERVLAERNRRDELVRASERAVQAEQTARRTLEQATGHSAELDAGHEREVAADRSAVRARDEAAEDERRIGSLIERRRAAPDDGPNAGRRAQLAAELAAERSMLDRSERERTERAARIQRLDATIARDEQLGPLVKGVIEALDDAAAAIAERLTVFRAALAADREAGEHVAAELRACAQEEATLHGQLHTENEGLTAHEVRAQRVRDQVAEVQRDVHELAGRLELEAAPAESPLGDEERNGLTTRLERLNRRREQLGPVNPLAQEEYAQALEHVEELERQRADLETAMRELEKLIADTDKQIRETFEETFEAAARNFEELSEQLFPGGKGRLRLVSERGGPAAVLGAQPAPTSVVEREDGSEGAEGSDGEDTEDAPEEDLLGVEIEITPAGKAMKRLSLLSGGEKSMTALAFLFSVFLAKPCPFYILDEVEAALDDVNIDRFLALLGQYSKRAQFIVVTHQKRTMEAADSLYGVSMGGDGISKVISRRLPQAA